MVTRLDAEALVVGDLVVHVGVDPSVHAGPVAGLDDLGYAIVQHLPHLGPVGHAHGLPEVLGAELVGVDVGNGEDGGKVLDALEFLDLEDDEGLAVGDFGVLLFGVADAVVTGTGDGIEGAVALGVEAAGVDDAPGLVDGVDLGDVDALGASVKEAEDEVGVVGDTHDGGDVVVLGGADGVEDGALVEDFVFEVEGDVVEAKGSEEFDGVGGVEADGGTEDHLAFLKFGLGVVRSHGLRLDR